MVLYLLNWAHFSVFVAYRTLNTKKKELYKSFLHVVGRCWISESRVQPNQVLITFSCQKSKQHQGGLNRTHQADSSGISEYTNWKKSLLVGMEERIILQVVVKCVLHVRSKVKLDTFVNSALFRFTNCPFFEKYHSVRKYATLYMHFLMFCWPCIWVYLS